MSAAARVLVVDRHADVLLRYAEILGRQGGEVVAETAAGISEALEKLRKAGFDAVVCRVDGPDEVSFLIRIKNLAPRTPLVALTPGANPALDDLARESGADDVQTAQVPQEEPGRRATLRIRRLIARSRELRRRGRELIAEHRGLIARNRVFSDQRIEQVRRAMEGFRPLLVEDSPDQIRLMQKALEKASLPLQLPVMTNGQDAISYLAGEGEYADRERHPLPSLVILDLNLPRKSGLEVIEWIRARPEFAKLPVYMLTSSPDDLQRALELGVNDYFTKPLRFETLIDIVRTIALRWWFYVQAHDIAGR